jgi:serine protease Do
MTHRFISPSRVAVAVPHLARWTAVVVTAFIMMAVAVQANARSAPDSFADLAEKLLPSVVNISTTQTLSGRSGPEIPQLPPGSPFEDFFKEFFDRNAPQQQRKATSLGSGFIIHSNGNNESYVITNNHVIDGADEVTVILQDDTRMEAEVIGHDPKTDVAVLKVKSDRKLPAVEFGDSRKTRVGDWVVAIGNPFGLGGTVTAGIVSATARDINSGPYDDFIQTDASINRGNSGGPLFNLDGEVIGINTAIFSPSGGSVGIGFARSSASAGPVIRQLIKHGTVRRGWLGVHIQTVTDEMAEALGLDTAKGALVASVLKDGPAEKGGIEQGDVILKFDGKDVTTMRLLPRIVAETEIDKSVGVEVWRDGEVEELSVKIGEMSQEEAQASAGSPHSSGQKKVARLGLTLSPMSDAARNRFDLTDDAKGVVVVDAVPNGPAASKGVRPGDVIVEVNQREVNTPEQVEEQIASTIAAGRKSVLMLVEGQGGLRFIPVRVADDG